MWIAKNSITGKTYGDKFDNIYDCQSFIDSKLFLLEYEMQRCFSLEKDIVNSLKNRALFEIIKDAIDEFKQSSGLEDDLKCIVEHTLFKDFKQKDLDNELLRLASLRWQKNNIIRCWYVEQNRFADGFDF